MKPSIFQLYFCSTCWPIQAGVDQMGFLQSILKSSEINISSCFICHINNDRNTGTLLKSSDRPDQSAAHLPKKNAKNNGCTDATQAAYNPSPPPTSVSHRVKLSDSGGRAWERGEEGRERGSEALSHHHHPHPRIQHKTVCIVCSNTLNALLCFEMRSLSCESRRCIWLQVFLTCQPAGKHNPRAAKLRSFSSLREARTIEMVHLVSCRWSQHSPCFQHSFRGNWRDTQDNSCPTVRPRSLSRTVGSLCRQSSFKSSC